MTPKESSFRDSPKGASRSPLNSRIGLEILHISFNANIRSILCMRLGRLSKEMIGLSSQFKLTKVLRMKNSWTPYSHLLLKFVDMNEMESLLELFVSRFVILSYVLKYFVKATSFLSNKDLESKHQSPRSRLCVVPASETTAPIALSALSFAVATVVIITCPSRALWPRIHQMIKFNVFNVTLQIISYSTVLETSLQTLSGLTSQALAPMHVVQTLECHMQQQLEDLLGLQAFHLKLKRESLQRTHKDQNMLQYPLSQHPFPHLVD
jgi:hypothetical protein